MRNPHCTGDDRPLTALVGGPVRLVYELVIDPLRRRARHRAGARALACLDDRLLRDIGLTRAQVLAAAFGPVGSSRHVLAGSARAHLSEPGNVVRLKRRASVERVDATAATPLARRAARG